MKILHLIPIQGGIVLVVQRKDNNNSTIDLYKDIYNYSTDLLKNIFKDTELEFHIQMVTQDSEHSHFHDQLEFYTSGEFLNFINSNDNIELEEPDLNKNMIYYVHVKIFKYIKIWPFWK